MPASQVLNITIWSKKYAVMISMVDKRNFSGVDVKKHEDEDDE